MVVAKARPKTWSERLKLLRERLGLTQAEAAARVGCHPRSWQWWEAGKFEPHKLYQQAIEALENSQE